MQLNKIQLLRLVALDEQIRSGGFPNCECFAREWEVSARTIRRDVEYLRDSLRAPIVYCHAQRGYEYSHDAWVLPDIMQLQGVPENMISSTVFDVRLPKTQTGQLIIPSFVRITGLAMGQASLRLTLLSFSEKRTARWLSKIECAEVMQIK